MYIYIYDISGVQVVESRNAGKQISLGWRIVMFQNEYTPMTADIHYNMMIINCIYFFLICISFKFNGLSSIVFFFGKSCSSSCWWKGWIKMPQPIQLLPTKVLSMKSIQEKLFTNKNGWGFFWGIRFFFWISDRNVQVRLKLTEVSWTFASPGIFTVRTFSWSFYMW